MRRLFALFSLLCMGCVTTGSGSLTIQKSSGNDSVFVLAHKPAQEVQAPKEAAPKKAALSPAKATSFGGCGRGASVGALVGLVGGVLAWSGVYGSGMAHAGDTNPQGFLVGVLMGAGLSASGMTLGAATGCVVGASAAR